MARRLLMDGTVKVDGLKDLQKGDKVSVTCYGRRYYQATVKNVKTVDCATIVTIERHQEIDRTRFVGYYNERYAIVDKHHILSLDRAPSDFVEDSLEKASKSSDRVVSRAEALAGMEALKSWLLGTQPINPSSVEKR